MLILSEPGRHIDVILGGGRRKFLPANVVDVEGSNGQRKDGKNLVEQWKSQNAGINATYVQTVDELLKVDPKKTDRLLGIFSPNHMAYFHEQARDKDPTLTDMTDMAIRILSKNPHGFFLFVEGGKIDLAHHENQGLKAAWEAVEFDRAIKRGDELTSYAKDTLIVVTADHSHSYNLAGYAERGSPLTGIAGIGLDNLPYAIMNYVNGPGYIPFVNNTRHDITNDDRENLEYREVPLVPLQIETHGGEDVMIFAKGPHAHLFVGVHQQNYIPHAMAYAACLGPGRTFCRGGGVGGGWAEHY